MSAWKSFRWKESLWFMLVLFMLTVPAWGQEEAAPAAQAATFTQEMADLLANNKVAADTLWTLLTAMLVFFMNLGFGMIESGLTRAKNTVNILSKNVIVFAISSLAFLFVGWGFMFGDGTPFIGTQGVWMVSGPDNSPTTGDAYQGVYSSINWTGTPLWAKFFFQLVFAGTAATIVSGAVAERIRFRSFIFFSFIMVGLLYPITGHWIWGGGWLQQLGMWDFAGSTVVHSVGGWAALAGAVLLGPRLGKYNRDGTANPIPGHNMTAATIGAMVLWFGWFGFNPGSTMAADWSHIGRITVTTNSAAAAGAFAATMTAWWLLGKPDLSMSLNGILAGLVAITCPCAFVSVGSSVIIGAVAGVLVVLSVLFFDRMRVDDPVGAISVHLVCGVWGTFSLGLLAQDSMMPDTTGNGLFFGGGTTLLVNQIIGIAAVGAFTFAAAALAWGIIGAIMGMRVSVEEELEGLDWGEHGHTAYPDFQLISSPMGIERRTLEAELEETERRKERILQLMGSMGGGGSSAATTETRAPRAVAGGMERRAPSPPSSRVPPPSSVATTPPRDLRQPPSRVAEKTGGGPLRIVVDNVDKKFLKGVWEEMCSQYPHNVPQEFKDIYHQVTSFRDNIFTFRAGDARTYREKIANLLYRYGVENPQVRIE